MTRRVLWQTGIAFLGIVSVFAILFQLAASEVTVEQPVAGGTFVEGVLGYATVANPILAWGGAQADSVGEDVVALVFEGLTKLDDRLRVTPALATAWEVADDGRVYDFSLRRGVVWHDGAPLTAQDVVFTVQAIQDPQFQGDPALQALWRAVSVVSTDDYSVRFTLAEPFPSFLYYTAIGLLPAHLLSDVPASELSDSAFSTRAPVGTGPFRVSSLAPDHVVLEVNAAYWGQAPFLTQVELLSFGDEDALLASYRRGEIDGFRPAYATSLPDLARLEGLQLFSAVQAGYGVVFLNLARDTVPSFQVTEVRQAMLYALDRPKLIDAALGGQGLVASSPLPPLLWAHDPTVRVYGYDPERATGLLDSSGWVDTDGDLVRDQGGAVLRFELLAGPGQSRERMAAGIAEQWRAVGLEASVRQVSSDELATLLRSRDFDAVLIDVALSADPDPYSLWHSTQAGPEGQNYSGFSDQVADLAMEEARTSFDRARQSQAYAAFQQRFAEQVPALLIYYPVATYAVDSGVHGVQLSSLLRASDRFRNITGWYRETSEAVVTAGAVLDNR